MLGVVRVVCEVSSLRDFFPYPSQRGAPLQN